MSQIVSALSCCSLGFVFALLDTVSYGKALIPKHEHLSMFIFLTSTILAQVFYNIFTSIPSGIMASSIVENIKIYKKIHENTQDVTNTLACIFISTIVVGVVSIAASRYSSYLKLTPKSAITGCLGAIGFAQFEVGWDEVQVDAGLFYYMLVLAVIIGFVGFVLQEKCPSLIFIVPLYTVCVLVLFYVFGFNRMKMLRECKVLPKYEDTILGTSLFTENFRFGELRLKCISDNLVNIFTVVVLSMIHLPINMPAYCLETGLKADFGTEMRVQGVGNLICAFAFSPVYFVCSNSIFFRKSGGHKKIYGIISALSLIAVYFFGKMIRSFLPVFITSMFPFLIGFSFMYSTYNEIRQGSTFDRLVVIGTILIGAVHNMLAAMIFGVILNALWFIKAYLSSIDSNRKSNEEICNILQEGSSDTAKTINTRSTCDDIYIIDYILFFCTVPRFEKQVRGAKKDVVFVISYEMDWMGRDLFYETMNRLAQYGRVTVIGEFASFNVKCLSEKVTYYRSLNDISKR